MAYIKVQGQKLAEACRRATNVIYNKRVKELDECIDIAIQKKRFKWFGGPKFKSRDQAYQWLRENSLRQDDFWYGNCYDSCMGWYKDTERELRKLWDMAEAAEFVTITSEEFTLIQKHVDIKEIIVHVKKTCTHIDVLCTCDKDILTE